MSTHWRRHFGPGLLLGTLPFATGCAFVLDFGALDRNANAGGGTGGESNTGGSDGSGGSDAPGGSGGDGTAGTDAGGSDAGGTNAGGNAGTGGMNAGGAGGTADAGGAGGACGSCDDRNPCTDDSCAGGECQNTEILGVRPDGFAATIDLDPVTGLTLVAGGGRFYLATHGEYAAGSSEARLYSVAEDGTALQEGPSFNQLASNNLTLAPVALVPVAGDPFRLQSYFAFGASGDATAPVVPITFEANMTATTNMFTSIAVADELDGFRVVDATVGPSAALRDSGRPFVVWPSTTGLSFYERDLTNMADSVTPVTTETPVTRVAAVWLGQLRIGAAFTSVSSAGVTTINLAVVRPTGVEVVTMEDPCLPAGEIVGLDAELVNGDGVLADTIGITWTSLAEGSYVTHAASVSCNAASCTIGEVQPNCADEAGTVDAYAGVDTLYFRRPGDAPVYQATAVAVTTQTAAAALLGIAKVNPNSPATPVGGASGYHYIASSVNAQRHPPVHLRLASLELRTLLASWVERVPDEPDVVHVERFRACMPPIEPRPLDPTPPVGGAPGATEPSN